MSTQMAGKGELILPDCTIAAVHVIMPFSWTRSGVVLHMWEHDKGKRKRKTRDFDTELVGYHDGQVSTVDGRTYWRKYGCQKYTVSGAHGAKDRYGRSIRTGTAHHERLCK